MAVVFICCRCGFDVVVKVGAVEFVAVEIAVEFVVVEVVAVEIVVEFLLLLLKLLKLLLLNLLLLKLLLLKFHFVAILTDEQDSLSAPSNKSQRPEKQQQQQ